MPAIHLPGEDPSAAARTAKGRARNILTVYSRWIIAAIAALCVLWQVTEAMFPSSYALLAMARVPTATGLAADRTRHDGT